MSPIKIIYEHQRPKFAIGVDHYQWILATGKGNKGQGRVGWTNKSYYPNLSNLLDGLAEEMFKKNAKKLKQLKDLDKNIERVYSLISKVSTALPQALSGAFPVKNDSR